MRWEIAPGMPPVFADRQKLMQVFLNLAKNSERALQGSKNPELTDRPPDSTAAGG